MPIKDVRLYRDDEVVVTGHPGEIAKLKHEGWSEENPATPTPVPAPKPVPLPLPKLPEAAPKPQAPESK